MSRQAERDAQTETKTAKNRAKRQKRKHGSKGKSGKEGPAEAVGGGKRKLAGEGVGVVFRRPGEEEDGSEESEAGDVGSVVPVMMAEETVEAPRTAEEAKIIIHDD